MAYEVFISYAHEDQAFCEVLETHLSNLKNLQIVSTWFDKNIIPGSEWEKQIMHHLRTAQIILLLISADFMASRFCYSIEMKEALERHDKGEARVIPIILRPVDIEGAPFEKLLLLPTGGKPVTRWPSRDDAFLDIVKGIRRQVDNLQKAAKKEP
jgi:hypothetical protein